MARIVAGFGVPHVPFLAAQVVREGPGSETGQLFAKLRAAVEAVAPDVIVAFSTDHLNTFFYDNLPVFALGVTDSFTGPNDETEAVAPATVRSHPAFASHLRAAAIEDGFDVALVQEFSVDHSISVPLHFLTPAMGIPVVPVFINGHIPPLPRAARCLALGRSLGQAVARWDGDLDVAFLGSGSFSLEVLGPRMGEGLPFGVPDLGWAERIQTHLETPDHAALVAEATPARLEAAGNVAGELFNWLAMLGAIGEHRPDWVLPQPTYGHAYGFWRGSAA